MGIYCRLRSGERELELDKNWERGCARDARELAALPPAWIAERLGSKEITECYPCDGAIDRLDDADRALIATLLDSLRSFIASCPDGFRLELY